MRSKLVFVALCICTSLAGVPPVGAQTTDDRVAAESLFTSGRALMQAGKYLDACQKFEASRRLEPALGTTLNLANCYEKLGRTASAWAEFKSAAAEAQRVNDASRKATALKRAAALERKLSRLWLQAGDPSISVLRNGEPVDAGVLGNAIPVDPGTHELEARAAGKVPWKHTVEVKGAGATVEVRIPPLADGVGSTATGSSPPDAPPTMTRESSAQRTSAWISGGIGVAGVATSAVFGLLASSNFSKGKKTCRDETYECTRAGASDGDTARTQATVADVAFIVGGVGLGLSTVLFLTDTGGSESASAGAELRLEPTRVVVQGRF
jgi:hypothetical protein